MGLLDKIKNDVKKSGQNKGKFIYFREGNKQRVRFLTDMDDGMEVVFHDSFERSVKFPGQELFGRDCPYCGDDSLRTRSQYVCLCTITRPRKFSCLCFLGKPWQQLWEP